MGQIRLRRLRPGCTLATPQGTGFTGWGRACWAAGAEHHPARCQDGGLGGREEAVSKVRSY